MCVLQCVAVNWQQNPTKKENNNNNKEKVLQTGTRKYEEPNKKGPEIFWEEKWVKILLHGEIYKVGKEKEKTSSCCS